MIKNISNLGDAAIYCDFGKEINKEINTNVIRYFKSIQKKNIKGITNITPSYNKLIISFDLDLINYSDLKNQIENVKILSSLEDKVKTIKVPICCDDEFALDIDRLNKKLKLSKEEILNNYLNKNYFCYMTGFVAGMPFLGDIDKKLRLNRLETPRVKVPKGSVAITEQFCNIYTFESPGGWNIIGKTPLYLFDINKKDASILSPGDTVKFKSITKKDLSSFKHE